MRRAGLTDGVPGDLIETGVWRGGATILMRAILKARGVTDRVVWVADSFAGLPAPNAARYPLDAGINLHRFPQLAVTLERVQDNFRRYGLLDDQVRFLKGWFRDTLPAAPIERLAVLRLDGDLYESTIQALESLYDKLSAGRLRNRRRLRQRRGLPPGGARLPRRPGYQRRDPPDRLGRRLLAAIPSAGARVSDRALLAALAEWSGYTFPPNPPDFQSRSASPVRLNTPTRKPSVEDLLATHAVPMSLIAASEIFRANQSCENADDITITHFIRRNGNYVV